MAKVRKRTWQTNGSARGVPRLMLASLLLGELPIRDAMVGTAALDKAHRGNHAENVAHFGVGNVPAGAIATSGSRWGSPRRLDRREHAFRREWNLRDPPIGEDD